MPVCIQRRVCIPQDFGAWCAALTAAHALSAQLPAALSWLCSDDLLQLVVPCMAPEAIVCPKLAVISTSTCADKALPKPSKRMECSSSVSATASNRTRKSCAGAAQCLRTVQHLTDIPASSVPYAVMMFAIFGTNVCSTSHKEPTICRWPSLKTESTASDVGSRAHLHGFAGQDSACFRSHERL